jgi:hypothetical protein
MLMAAKSVPLMVLMPNRLPDTDADHLPANSSGSTAGFSSGLEQNMVVAVL